MINSTEDIKKFINDTSFKKIFILCGKKSFVTSGAKNFFKELLNNKEIKLFYKNSELPVLEELIKIIKDIKSFKPDLILAVGGGAVIDYAKIANVIDVRDDLADLIVNYSYPFKKNIQRWLLFLLLPVLALRLLRTLSFMLMVLNIRLKVNFCYPIIFS